MLALVQAALPGDCVLTGLCGVQGFEDGVASGVMFLALGLVVMGVLGLRSRRKNRISR